MITFLGVSGDTWSLVIQLFALAVSFIIGLRGYDRPRLYVTALPIGIAANVLGQIVFAGGGPGACAGMVIIPICCLIAACIGRGGWWLFWGRKRSRTAPQAEPRPAGNRRMDVGDGERVRE